MDKNVVKGKLKQMEGRVQDTAGAATGDIGAQVEGKAKQVAGTVQEEFGRAKDELRTEQHRRNRTT